MVSFDVKSLIFVFIGIFIFKIAVADQMREKRNQKIVRSDVTRLDQMSTCIFANIPLLVFARRSLLFATSASKKNAICGVSTSKGCLCSILLSPRKLR